MKLTLDESGRIIAYTRDALVVDFTTEVPDAQLPILEGEQTLFDFVYEDGTFTQLPPQDDGHIRIIPEAITGTIKHSSDLTMVSCHELTPITIEGECKTHDRNFQLPVRRDDGRLFFFDAIVRGGHFRVVINFPTVGEFIYTDKEANYGIPDTPFTVANMMFRVTRKEDSILTESTSV